MILERIDKPARISKLGNDELVKLADEIRQRIIEVVARNGGHIAPAWVQWI